MRRQNHVAKDLRTPKYRSRVVRVSDTDPKPTKQELFELLWKDENTDGN